jgi:hypothetical protein
MAKFFKTPLASAFIEASLTACRQFFTVRQLKSMHVSVETRRSV